MTTMPRAKKYGRRFKSFKPFNRYAPFKMFEAGTRLKKMYGANV
jgi:hypothetical protein